MKLQSDKETAARALAALRRLRLADRSTAITELASLSREVGNRRVEERDRAEAWLAVCLVWETLEKNPNSAAIPALWDHAITKMAAWHDAF
jgi:hypothetical protein